MTAIAVPGSVSVTLDHAVEVRLDRMTEQLALLTAEVRALRDLVESTASDPAAQRPGDGPAANTTTQEVPR